MKEKFRLIISFIKNLNFSLYKKKNPILILDKISEKKFSFLKKDFDIVYVDIRGGSLNFFILIKTIFFYLTSKASIFQSYLLAHIQHYNSKILISSQEVPKFFDVKLFNKKIKTIFFQLDSKDQASVLYLNKIKVKIDLIICTGKYWAKKYKNLTNINPIIISKKFLKKKINFNKNTLKKNIIYISTFRKDPQYDKTYSNRFLKNHFELDCYLLKIIKQISKENKIELKIIPTYKNKSKLYNINKLIALEKKYYSEILHDINYEIIYTKLSNFYLQNTNSLFVNTDSTLGYELASEGFKCVFFPIRKNVKITEFLYLPDNGYFWSKKENYKHIKKVIEQNYLDLRKTNNLKTQNYLKYFFSKPDDNYDTKVKEILSSL